MRYFAYLSKGKIAQLYDQISELSNATETYQVEGGKEGRGKASVGFKAILGGEIEGKSSRGFTAALTGQRSAIQKLRPLLSYIDSNEEVADLNDLCRQGAGARLDAFAYTYRGTFRVLGEIPRHSSEGLHADGIDDSREIKVNRFFRDSISSETALPTEHLLDPALRENGHLERTQINGGGAIVSDMAILLSTCEDYAISLACSYKYFSDMGARWDKTKRELVIHPHSGNYAFFKGEVSAVFECLLFINGVRSKTIFGSPLFLAYAPDGNLRL